MQEQWLRRLQGRMGGLEGYLKQGAERYSTLPSWRCSLAVLYSDMGRVAEARSEFERLAVDQFAVIPRDHLWLHCLTVLAEVCAVLGDDHRAATLYELLLPYADRCVVPGNIHFCAGSVAHYLGLLATVMSRWDDAEMHFDAALERHTHMGARPLLAHTHYARATMLLARRRRTDRRRARDLLEEARALYSDLGMSTYATRAAAQLARPSLATTEAAAVVYPNGLTEREVEVLRLLAAGKSNREIATQLVLSVRTAERHIANIYEKIGARGKVARAVATAYALLQDLTPSPLA
jgi:DNA-binding CsgD family transcriptional regulator